jgi:NADH dehydrogenase
MGETGKTETKRPHVVIIGAGFGGLTLARRLRRLPVDVLLVDQHNYHTFQPLLYQVATAGLEAEEIAHAVRGIFHRQPWFAFRLDRVVGVDLAGRRIRFSDGAEEPFDFLVVAAGTVTHYFNVEGAETHALPLKSLPEAIHLRSHIMETFERASEHPEMIDDGALTMVVVGGGPTGVEMAGALYELACTVLAQDFPAIATQRVSIKLIEASDEILSPFHPRLRMYALKTLRRKGIDVLLNHRVKSVTRNRIFLADGSVLPAHTLVWAAGVRPSPLAAALGTPLTKQGRLAVEPDLSLPGYPHVFAIGDIAGSVDDEGRPHPQIAPVAIQGGRHVARQIRARLEGRAASPFVYVDRGFMATIGRNAAVTQLSGGIRATGFVAWAMWLVIHLIQLVGFRNKLQVMINWAWNYFTYDRSARLILPIRETQEYASSDLPSRSEPEKANRVH